MFPRLLILSALAAGIWSHQAAAAIPPASADEAPTVAPNTGSRLAQSGEVEIYYDERGRRIIVDAYTGEVLAIERPRRVDDRQLLLPVGDREARAHEHDDRDQPDAERQERVREVVVDHESQSVGDIGMLLTPDGDGLTARTWSTPMRFSSNAREPPAR